MRRVALGALQGLSSRRRLRRCIGRLEVLGVLAPGRGRSRAGRRHAHHRAWRWNSNRACERALRYQLGDKIHGFTVNQDLQNLLSVYLDATFFPCLRELDFWVKSEEAPGTFSEGLGGRRTRWMKNKKEMHQHSLAGSVTHRTRMKTCTPAVRAFSLTGAPRAISTGHYVDASVTKWKASGPGGACSDQERPESKKHGEQMHDAQGWMAGLRRNTWGPMYRQHTPPIAMTTLSLRGAAGHMCPVHMEMYLKILYTLGFKDLVWKTV
ncbi:uncharacterized protein [Macaca nemestrina]|uniref:uncharacterized protein isoform X7 n=1 Tax=Macaca nemestrina TaxID=9545 RepID=UPI0039B97ADE